MTNWTPGELDRIGQADELALAARRTDGTLRRPVTIWVVRQGDDLYVRSYKGRPSPWFQWALEQREGHVRAAGVERDVAFAEETDPATNDALDAAYRTRYRRFGATYVDPMVAPAARAATLRLVPRSAPGS
jgi:hypothetical protein